MGDVCVHCGQPIEFVNLTHDWMHRVDTRLWRLCADKSGHQACPAQGGYE